MTITRLAGPQDVAGRAVEDAPRTPGMLVDELRPLPRFPKRRRIARRASSFRPPPRRPLPDDNSAGRQHDRSTSRPIRFRRPNWLVPDTRPGGNREDRNRVASRCRRTRPALRKDIRPVAPRGARLRENASRKRPQFASIDGEIRERRPRLVGRRPDRRARAVHRAPTPLHRSPRRAPVPAGRILPERVDRGTTRFCLPD